MEDVIIDTPDFCPMCQQNVEHKNVYFDYVRVPKDIFVPGALKESYYCFKCFSTFMHSNRDELDKFKLIHNE